MTSPSTASAMAPCALVGEGAWGEPADPAEARRVLGRAGYLIQCVEMSLRQRRLKRIDLYQLHQIDPRTL
jgi:aryl-alcohol dehydrogenase-like predicted oxidoreductase